MSAFEKYKNFKILIKMIYRESKMGEKVKERKKTWNDQVGP